MSADTEIKPPWASWLERPFEDSAMLDLGWLESERHGARERIGRQGLPSMRQEAWRYTSLKSLVEQEFRPQTHPITGLTTADLTPVLVPGLDTHRVVLVNGWFMPELSNLGDLPPGVRADSLRAILHEDPNVLACHLNKLAAEGVHLFSDLNTAGMEDGFVLLVDPATKVERPLEILHLAVADDVSRVAQPRHLVVLGKGAGATLIERYASLDASLYCTNSVSELLLEEDAILDHYRIQTESRNAFHLTGVYLRQGRGSRYHGSNLGLGAAWSRTDLVVRFAGPHAQCELEGLYLAGDKQLMDHHLDLDHGIGRCTSRETFKGILHGKGRAVFDGRIRVARDAQQTDAQLTNRNLLLSRAAEVDTKPQLEILADDVKCSHGATVGQIDPQALFYLRSRGIPEHQARRMLCLGFAGEIIDGLGPEPLREFATRQVASLLEPIPLDGAPLAQAR